jgi:hypothetical protein
MILMSRSEASEGKPENPEKKHGIDQERVDSQHLKSPVIALEFNRGTRCR